jgi:DNA invertase Pin-like site-specific DNA recombinase
MCKGAPDCTDCDQRHSNREPDQLHGHLPNSIAADYRGHGPKDVSAVTQNVDFAYGSVDPQSGFWGKFMSSKGKVHAIAYLRTSSAANVGADKDSDRRQREAIASFAKRAGYELVAEFYDAAVSGADAIDSRPGFTAMLEQIEGNGVRTIIVETASRFARDLMVQEVGHAKLYERGIDLIAADNPGSFIDDTPTAKLVRQVLGAISEFDKAMTVAKLRGAASVIVGRTESLVLQTKNLRSIRETRLPTAKPTSRGLCGKWCR